MATDFARNRKIKEDRVYKTLGRMSWQRIVLGAILLIYVFMLAGTVSEFFLNHGHPKAADTFMVEAWMDQYKPEEKALIKAWVAYGEEDIGKAYSLLSDLDYEVLPEKLVDEYAQLCRHIGEYYTAHPGSDSVRRADEMFSAAEAIVLPSDAE